MAVVNMSLPLNQTMVYDQHFMIYDRFGDEIPFTLGNLAGYIHNGIVPSIVLAVQIGASAAILILLLMLTKHEKRRSPVFVLNSLALCFNVIAVTLACLYYTGSWFDPYAVLTGDFSFISSASKAVSISKLIFTLVAQGCIEISLVLQVHVVCVTLDQTQRLMVLLISMFVALTATGFTFAELVVHAKYNIIMTSYNDNAAWITKARDITLTISICFFSAVFCAKLGWSLLQRRQLGLTQFGPMQVIFIGGTQTLVIPVIFAILQFAAPLTSIDSYILTLTAISLPLTALWASAIIDNPNKAARGPDAHRKFLVSSSGADTIGSSKKTPRHPSSYTNTADSDLDTGRYDGSRSSHAPIGDIFVEPHAAVDENLEMQDLV